MKLDINTNSLLQLYIIILKWWRTQHSLSRTPKKACGSNPIVTPKDSRPVQVPGCLDPCDFVVPQCDIKIGHIWLLCYWTMETTPSHDPSGTTSSGDWWLLSGISIGGCSYRLVYSYGGRTGKNETLWLTNSCYSYTYSNSHKIFGKNNVDIWLC